MRRRGSDFPKKDASAGLIDEIESPEWAVACGLALSSMRTQIREYSTGENRQRRKSPHGLKIFAKNFADLTRN